MKMGGACVALCCDEEVCPYHPVDDVADAHEFSLSGAVCVHFLFFTEVDDGSLTKGHGAARVAFKIWMDCERCVDPLVDEAHVGYFEGEAEAWVSLEVSEKASELLPVVFVGVFDACG